MNAFNSRSSMAPQLARKAYGGKFPSRFSHTVSWPHAVMCKAEAAGTETASSRDVFEGRMTYKPDSYSTIIEDASSAVVRGIEEGLDLMEVEFPAIAGLDAYKGASDLYIDANTQLAIRAGAEIYKRSGKRTVVLLPDAAEYARSSKLFQSSLDMCEGVSMSHLFEGREPLVGGLKMLFGMDNDAKAPAKAANADVHIVINISTGEILDTMKYRKEVAKEGSALIFWNCELDTLRSDLGLFGFPPKSVQYDFLSFCKPVFYIRQRDYSKTVNIAPFIINYSGCLFREFPAPWQVMLRQDGGEYACVAEDRTRYTLGEVKEELLDAMGLKTEEEGSTMEFLRRGYKTSTWWEDDEDVEKSNNWRT